MDGTNMTPHEIIRAMRREIESLRAQLAEKERECERLRTLVAQYRAGRALENDDG